MFPLMQGLRRARAASPPRSTSGSVETPQKRRKLIIVGAHGGKPLLPACDAPPAKETSLKKFNSWEDGGAAMSEASTEAPLSDCEDTPKSSAASPWQEMSEMPFDATAATADCANGPLLWSAEDFALRTPSRQDGVTEREERVARAHVCSRARTIVRSLVASPSNAILEEVRLQAQVLACNLIQVFFMSCSTRSEDAQGDVAAAAASLAVKAQGVPCELEDVLRACGASDAAGGERVAEAETRLLASIASVGGVSRLELPLGPLDGLVALLVERLPELEEFCDACGRRVPEQVARSLGPQLAQVARRFAMDAAHGVAVLSLPPSAVAGAAVALAARVVLRQEGTEVDLEELLDVLSDPADEDELRELAPAFGPGGFAFAAEATATEPQLRRAVQEAMAVFRSWREECPQTPRHSPARKL
mmetsp:Transcript_47519/g.122777  ORF Transcript_47519/g.122777 Transcript_47519/m.122777 type:complete len:419 (+) Transcript_47519:81-1337(+)